MAIERNALVMRDKSEKTYLVRLTTWQKSNNYQGRGARVYGFGIERENMMSTLTDPISVVDRNTAAKIINAVIMKYYAEHNGHKDWVHDAIDELSEDFSIEIGVAGLRQHLSGLKRDTRDCAAASDFNGKISARSGKDGMYREFDSVVSLMIKDKKYVGLPANQIISVSRKYNSVVACERDKHRFQFMDRLKGLFSLANVKLVRGDILQYLRETDERFSVFDIDMMTYVNQPRFVHDLAIGIANAAADRAAICLVTCFGRKITRKGYEEIMPARLIEKLRILGRNVIYSRSGEYVDQIIPMKFEFLVIE